MRFCLQMHLFDIYIPEDLSFKESDTFTARDGPTNVDGTIAIAEKSRKIESQYCMEL